MRVSTLSTGRVARRAAVAASAVLAGASLAVAGAMPASAAFTGGGGAPAATPPGFAEPGLATIHPGVVTVTKGAGACTGNFVFTDAAKNLYLGQAAHCSGTSSDATETNGCTTGSLPLGTPVTLGASGVTGKLAYNSWLAMQRLDEQRPNPCAFNDLALVKIPRGAAAQVNPSIPVFGGPTGVDTDGTRFGESVSSYGNSPLRQGIAALSPKEGTSLGDAGNGWSHRIYTVTPGVPGDSGSAVLNSAGEALGVLSTVTLAPIPGANGIADLHRTLSYAQQHSGIKGLRLVRGTDNSGAGLLPL